LAGDGHDGEVVVSADAQIVYGTVAQVLDPPLILSSFLISCGKKEQLNFTYPSGSIYEGEWLEQ